jgi:predicted esterase
MRYFICLFLIVFGYNSYATIIEKEQYVIYLPTNYNPAKSYPMLLFCDPHGSGVYPISLYKDLADSFEYILVGSNVCKNGADIILCEAHIRKTIEEIFISYHILKDNVSIAGFSGGSYFTYHMAHFSTYFKSIIISGTPIRPIPIEPYPNILCFAGNTDMNYTDLMALDSKLKEINYPSKYLTIEYNGKHEWPDASTFYDAFIFLNSMYCYACKINQNESQHF